MHCVPESFRGASLRKTGQTLTNGGQVRGGRDSYARKGRKAGHMALASCQWAIALAADQQEAAKTAPQQPERPASEALTRSS